MIVVKRILVPTDFSDFSRQATRYAGELASKFGAQIGLLHVIESPAVAMPSPKSPLPSDFDENSSQCDAQRLAQWIHQEEREMSLDVTRTVVRGLPFVEIVRFAKAQDSDLIVIDTHGRGGLAHAIIGSVVEKVIRKAPCPVLSVRPEGRTNSSHLGERLCQAQRHLSHRYSGS